jgi:hypothetical protein
MTILRRCYPDPIRLPDSTVLADVARPHAGTGARHNDAELVHHGIEGLANIRRYGSDSHLGEVIPKQLRLRREALLGSAKSHSDWLSATLHQISHLLRLEPPRFDRATELGVLTGSHLSVGGRANYMPIELGF